MNHSEPFESSPQPFPVAIVFSLALGLCAVALSLYTIAHARRASDEIRQLVADVDSSRERHEEITALVSSFHEADASNDTPRIDLDRLTERIADLERRARPVAATPERPIQTLPTLDASPTRAHDETAPALDPDAIPAHTDDRLYMRITSIEERKNPRLLKRAVDLETEARRAHADAESRRPKIPYDTYQELKRAAYALDRDARRERALYSQPDIHVAGEDHLGRDVLARFDHRWKQRVYRHQTGDIVALRGDIDTQSEDRLEIAEAALMPM